MCWFRLLSARVLFLAVLLPAVTVAHSATELTQFCSITLLPPYMRSACDSYLGRAPQKRKLYYYYIHFGSKTFLQMYKFTPGLTFNKVHV